jgi:hypothetical protein
MRVAPTIRLTAEQREELEQCARARLLSARLVERARIVLLAAAGKQDKDVAADLGVSAQKVARWRKRFLALGLAGLEKDAPRPGRTSSISAAKVKRVIQKNNTGEAGPSNSLVYAIHGRRSRPQRGDGAAHLAQERTEATPGGDV